jgi:hypothetical protein
MGVFSIFVKFLVTVRDFTFNLNEKVALKLICANKNVLPSAYIGNAKLNHILQGPFIAAFASTNLGDVSPNLDGPKCIDTGLECDLYQSTCDGKTQNCIAAGPGSNPGYKAFFGLFDMLKF